MMAFEWSSAGISNTACLTLLHSLWQGLLVVAIVLFADYGLFARKDRLRYLSNVLGILVLGMCVPVTFWYLRPESNSSAIEREPARSVAAAETAVDDRFELTEDVRPQMVVIEPKFDEPIESELLIVSPNQVASSDSPVRIDPLWLVLLAYCVGVLAMLCRLMISVTRLKVGLRSATILSSGEWYEALQSFRMRSRLKFSLRLAKWEKASAPMVIGIIRPLIIVPTVNATGLTPDQLQLLLAHEVAHIRRYDMWVNLIQRLLEALLFFNPFIWYLNRRTDTLREYACDESACNSFGSSRETSLDYATALLSLVEHRKSLSQKAEILSMAVHGNAPSQFRKRIARVLDEPVVDRLQISPLSLLLISATLALALLVPTYWQSQLNASDHNLRSARHADRLNPVEVQDQSNSAVEEDAMEGPILEGTVRDSEGRPVEGVQIILYGGVATRFRGQEATTDSEGNYQFAPLRTGAMTWGDDQIPHYFTGVKFNHPNLVPADGQSWRDIRVLRSDEHVERLDMTMTMGGRIKGVVIDDETNEPIPGLGLRIMGGQQGSDPDNFTFFVYADTDENGQFTSPSLIPSDYIIDINDGDFRGKRYPKIGHVSVSSGEEAVVELSTGELPTLQDPFVIRGTAFGEDGKSMVYGGVGIRVKDGSNSIRSRGGGIDGRSVFNLQFGTMDRLEATDSSPYGVGTLDVEFIGNNRRFGYELVRRIPDEPLRITDDPNQAELEDGIRYIRAGEPFEVELIFAEIDEADQEDGDDTADGSDSDDDSSDPAIDESHPDIAELNWGPVVDELRMGWRAAPSAKSLDRLCHRDWIRCEIWIENQSESVIHIPRDPREYHSPAIRRGMIDLLGTGTFLSFGLPIETLDAHTLTIAPGEIGHFALAQTQLVPTGTSRGRFGPTPVACEPGRISCGARLNISYLQGGDFDRERSDYQSTTLSAGVVEIEVKEESRIQVLQAYLMTEQTDPDEVHSDANLDTDEWIDQQGIRHTVVVNWGAEPLVSIDDARGIVGMPRAVSDTSVRLPIRVAADAQSRLSTYVAQHLPYPDRKDLYVVAIMMDGELVGAMKLDQVSPEEFGLDLVLENEQLDQFIELID